MKKFIFILVFILTSLSIYSAGTPTLVLITSYAKTLGAGSSDTTVVTGVSLAGDSIGVMVNISQDSISGNVKYIYVSPSGYSDTTQFANYPVAVTIPNNSKGTFGQKINRVAGSYQAYYYVIIKNNKTSIQTITTNIYNVIWR